MSEFGTGQYRQQSSADDPEVEVVEDVDPYDQDPSGLRASGIESLHASYLKGQNDAENGEEVPFDYDAADEETEAMANKETTGAEGVVDDPTASVGEEKPSKVVLDETLPEDSEKQSPLSADSCFGFKCFGCPNGAMQILFAQFFLGFGLLLCSWSMLDCNFIEATAGYPERYYPRDNPVFWNPISGPPTAAPSASPTMAPPPDTRRGFGFIFNETKSGSCGFNDNGRYWADEEFEYYHDFLGSGWVIPLALSGASLSMGWLLFLGTFTFWCCSYIRAIRWVVATAMILVMTGFQCSSFAVLGSGFCDEEGADCKPGRGFWFGVGGVFSYFFSAIFFFFMRDYPGRA